MSKRRPKACGNLECGVSSGIAEELTFGSGKLDFNGYWQHPCLPCAEAFMAAQPKMATEYGVWPKPGV